MEEKARLPFSQFFFRARFLNLLILILAMLLVQPFIEGSPIFRIIASIFLTAVFLSGIYAISHIKSHLFISVALVLIWLTAHWSAFLVDSTFVLVVGNLCGAAFFALAVINILSFIYSQQEITRDIIHGAALVYLLMALSWSLIYRVVELAHPGSFNIPQAESGDFMNSFHYFSLVTITTLGYGDITPATTLARILSVLEAAIGQLYLVITVARLVGMHISQSMHRQQ